MVDTEQEARRTPRAEMIERDTQERAGREFEAGLQPARRVLNQSLMRVGGQFGKIHLRERRVVVLLRARVELPPASRPAREAQAQSVMVDEESAHTPLDERRV